MLWMDYVLRLDQSKFYNIHYKYVIIIACLRIYIYISNFFILVNIKDTYIIYKYYIFLLVIGFISSSPQSSRRLLEDIQFSLHWRTGCSCSWLSSYHEWSKEPIHKIRIRLCIIINNIYIVGKKHNDYIMIYIDYSHIRLLLLRGTDFWKNRCRIEGFSFQDIELYLINKLGHL